MTPLADSSQAILRAKELIAAGRLREATKLLRRAAVGDPFNGEVRDLLAKTLVQMGKGRQALAASRDAVLLAPNSRPALEALAEAELLTNALSQAERTAVLLIATYPDSAVAYDIRGRVALRERRNIDAEIHFVEAVRLDPSDWRYWNNFGVALQKLGRNQDAIDAFGRAVSVNPRAVKARTNLFGSTDAFVGAGGAVVFVLALELLPEIERQLHLPAALTDGLFFGGLLAAIVGMWLWGRHRRRQLSPALDAFYRGELSRQLKIELARGAFKAGPVVISAIAVVLIGTSYPDALLPLIVAGTVIAVGWLFIWQRIWSRAVLPKLWR